LIVLDASAAIELLIDSERGRLVDRHLEEADGRVHAPDLLDLEVAQVLRRWEAAGRLGPARGRATVEILADLPIRRHPARPLLPRVWALRGNLTAYDAAYVALAEALDCPLVTFDERIAAAPGHEARVVMP
jgi:predicted nucleic acid-binding protein